MSCWQYLLSSYLQSSAARSFTRKLRDKIFRLERLFVLYPFRPASFSGDGNVEMDFR